MIKADKLNQKIRRNPNNVKFQDLVNWLENNGFSLDRVNGSHHIFVHPTIETPVNIQKERWYSQNLPGKKSDKNH